MIIDVIDSVLSHLVQARMNWFGEDKIIWNTTAIFLFPSNAIVAIQNS